MKKFLFAFSLLISLNAFGGLWSLSTRAERVNDKDEFKKSFLHFAARAGGGERTYVPSAPPWGVYDSKEVVLSGKTYFITFWADGARDVYYRVFNPDESGAPVCEFSTESERPQVRFKNNQIEYLETMYQRDGKKITAWKNCLPVKTADKIPASVPPKKPALLKKSKTEI